MQFSTIYNIFIRDFRKQKKRLTLTLLALGWGTISIMLLLAFGEGIHRQMHINQKGMGEGIAILWGGQTQIPFKGLGKGRPIRLHAEDPEYIKCRVPDIKYITGEYHRWGARVKYKDVVLSEHVSGNAPEFEQMRNFIPDRGGRMINALDVKLRRRVTFLGDQLKVRLFGDEDPIGKRIQVHGVPFTVIGVMIPKMQMSSYSGMDEDMLSIPNTTFKAVFGDPWLEADIRGDGS